MMDLNIFHGALLSSFRSVGTEITSPWFYTQIGLILVAAGIAVALATVLRSRIDINSISEGWPKPLRLLFRALLRSADAAIFVLLTLSARLIMAAMTSPSRSYLLITAASLAFAWLIIRLATSMIQNELVVRLLSISTWAVAALNIVGLLNPTLAALDSVAISLSGIRLTPLLVIKATLSLAVALWLASVISKFLESRITSSHDLTPSLQVLLGKMVRLLLIIAAVAIVMAQVGINLSSLAILSGAVGVGVGFGLQKIVANFISGIILLVDKSVKPGDLVTIGDHFGRIGAMNTRYISVVAGDGRVFLIPNEDLVTQKVVNWTYSDKNTLVEVKFGTNYDADPQMVCDLAVRVAKVTPRVTDFKPPTCLLTEFAEYGMKFSLIFWIADPDAGMGNVRSDVMLALWDAFKREGIRVPYPIRDIRIQNTVPVDAVIESQN